MKHPIELDKALSTKYPFAAIPDPEGEGWEIVFPDIPGVVGYAESWEAIGEEARSILSEWMVLEDEDGHPLPPPSDDWNPIERQPDDFAVPKLYSAEEAAAELGISKRRVISLAKSREVGRIIGNSLAFTDQDVEAMRDRTPGRPKSSSVA